MAIEIRIESSWDVDDGEGRRVEVTVSERLRPSDDPLEHSRYFASGDLDRLGRYLCQLLEEKKSLFLDTDCRECGRCGNVVSTRDGSAEFVCPDCHSRA